jgi:hypothetical protein
VLPAFGAFTGMHVLPRGLGDRVFVVADDAVRALPHATPLPATEPASPGHRRTAPSGGRER